MPVNPSIQTEYGHNQEYENTAPDKFFEICGVTDLINTRYNPGLPPTDNPDEFMKRPVRYCFTVFARPLKTNYLPSKYTYIFDNKEEATHHFKQQMSIWIDSQLEPYRKIVAKGYKLTLDQIEKCKRIQGLLPED